MAYLEPWPYVRTSGICSHPLPVNLYVQNMLSDMPVHYVHSFSRSLSTFLALSPLISSCACLASYLRCDHPAS